MGAVQMESGALVCPTCKGFGVVRGCGHMGACPCGGVTCPDCNDESGVVTCDCGETATKMEWRTREPICDSCGYAEGEEPRGDHPMGGMGYGIDYGHSQREARRLK